MKSFIKIFILVAGIATMYSCDFFKSDEKAKEEAVDVDSLKIVEQDSLKNDTTAKADEKPAPDTGIVVKEEKKEEVKKKE
ncbi:MAG: hypothetical protein K2X86_17500 [Cytophagaceae bacterium]|nr:hypothetical protein [Cytophagaceae bacterium]